MEHHSYNMEVSSANPDSRSYETNDVTYNFTPKTFTKTSRPPFKATRPDGTVFTWSRSWNNERITNEARALEIVSTKTTIFVPRLIAHGVHSDGRRYLVTAFVEGVTLNEFQNRGCSMPEGRKHSDGAPCKTCLDQAYSNALEFINHTVLPQLSRLKSHERGIGGFVMPPSWLSPDVDPPWIGKGDWKTFPHEVPDYVFQHGDLAAHNIIMDPQTFQVKALIDWEHAGFFPPGMERWPGSLSSEAYRERASDLADAIAKYLAVEYLECYERWNDKTELDELIKAGELPHPGPLKDILESIAASTLAYL